MMEKLLAEKDVVNANSEKSEYRISLNKRPGRLFILTLLGGRLIEGGAY